MHNPEDLVTVSGLTLQATNSWKQQETISLEHWQDRNTNAIVAHSRSYFLKPLHPNLKAVCRNLSGEVIHHVLSGSRHPGRQMCKTVSETCALHGC
jgi:hypothetical protein